jgi:hypothetical protein
MEFPFTSTMQEVPTSEKHKVPSKMSSSIDISQHNKELKHGDIYRVVTIFSFVEGPHPHRHLHLVAHPPAQLLFQLLKLFSCCSAAAPAASAAPGAPSLLLSGAFNNWRHPSRHFLHLALCLIFI